VADASPAIFAGPGDILNCQSGSYSPNSTDNPAPPGSVIVLFATGAGIADDTIPEASISLVASSFRASRFRSLSAACRPRFSTPGQRLIKQSGSSR